MSVLFESLLLQCPSARQWQCIVALAASCWLSDAATAGTDVWTPIGPENAQVMSVVTDPSTNTKLYATVSSGDLYRSSDAGTSWTRITPPQPSIAACGSSPPAVQSDGAVYFGTCNGLYKSTDAGVSWTPQGLPNAEPVADLTNPMVLYAPASNGVSATLFKTTNGGGNWLPIQSNLAFNTVIQLLVDATLPSRLYALAQNSVYRSLDGGATWNAINTGLPAANFESLALSGSTLFVGTDGFGVYKTVDNGASWTPANNGISTQSITIVRAGGGSTLYAAAQSNSTYPFTVVTTPLFKSSDGGATWFPAGNLDTRLGDFTVSRQSDSILYAATQRGLAISTDAGASWTLDPDNGLTNATVFALYLDALGSSSVYARSSLRGYKSIDRGADWSLLGLPDGSLLLPIGVSPSRSGTVYGWGSVNCTTGCTIYRSTNFGGDWTPLPVGVFRVNVTSLLEAPNAPGLLFVVGTQFAGGSLPYVARSDDGGATWGNASAGLPVAGSVGAAAMDPSNSNVLYAGVDNGVYKTVNGGGIWVNASGGLPQSRVNAVAVSPAQPNTIFAGLGDYQSASALYGLYRSDDGGTTWGPRNPAFVNLAVTALAIDPSNPSNVYAGTGGGGLYRSTDGGNTFRPINNGLTDVASLSVKAIAVDPADGRNLYVGTNAGTFAMSIDRYDSFVPVIEFYNYNLDHYFMASETQPDVPALDSGAFGGWTRTGQTFKAHPQPMGNAQPVCRFYIPPQHGDSHFYSASTSECAAVLDASTDPANPAYPNYNGYVYETPNSFYVDVPANGSCPPGEAPVYRLWNKRVDSNHRYTTDPAIRDAMIAKGYVLEGVVMCSLP